jgi:citrate lyase subunit beta/citryl-CoA lyase
VFSPNAREIARAQRIVDAYASASDGAAISVDGRMVDAPVAERARAVLALAAQLDAGKKPARRK